MHELKGKNEFDLSALILTDKDPFDKFVVDFYCNDLQLATEIDGDSRGFDDI